MANINKSFNFRNGVQVDDDNFIVNANGLVGIGTSIPREILDVHGTAKITGLVTTTNLAVSGVSTFYNNVKVGSAITAISSTGVLYATQFVGSAAGLTGIFAIATDGWYVNAGTLSTASKVGIGTTIPYYSLQVGNDPLIGNGFSVDALSGNVNTTGILTASNLKTIGSITGYNFSGFGTDITGINATNISNGTLNNSRLPSSINLTGIITAYSFSGFGTGITGINATNISNGTLNNSRLPTNLNISGIITANSGVITSLTSGIASITHLYVSGVTTSVQGFVGNLVGIASTALSLSGSPSITVANISSTDINNSGVVTSSNLHIGTGGVNFTALSSGKVGIGTTNPTSELQIRKSGQSLLEVISDTSSARISIGQSVGVGKSTAVFRFGGSEKTLDIINNDTGDINLYLHAGPAGIGTGRFDWIYGQTNAELMSLTYEGKLGIGKTNPNETFHIVGTSTVTSNAYFGNHIYVKENIYFKSLKDGVVETNTYVTNGISTFSTLYLYGGNNVLGIATNNAGSYKFKIGDNSPAYLGNNVGIGTTNATDPVLSSQTLFKVFGNSYLRSANIGTSISIGSGIVTASSFSGSASGLTSIPAGNLTGALPAIDGSALIGIVGSGSGIVVKDSGSTVGTAATIDFGDNLTVSPISAGIVTVTGSASGGVRTTLTASTGSIGAGATVNMVFAGFKTYSLLKVGISSAAWVVLYTDSTSRANDASRNYLTDPTPGSGVIAEVRTVSSGISTFIMSPGVIGWNNDAVVTNSIYAKITNNESSTSTGINITLTLVKLED